MHTKVVQMLFVSEQRFQSSYLWLQMFILMGYCAILAVQTSAALYVCSQPCQHIAFGDFIFVQSQWNWSLGEAKNVTPVGARRCFGRAGREAGGRWVGAGLRQRAQPGHHGMCWEFILPKLLQQTEGWVYQTFLGAS